MMDQGREAMPQQKPETPNRRGSDHDESIRRYNERLKREHAEPTSDH